MGDDIEHRIHDFDQIGNYVCFIDIQNKAHDNRMYVFACCVVGRVCSLKGFLFVGEVVKHHSSKTRNFSIILFSIAD